MTSFGVCGHASGDGRQSATHCHENRTSHPVIVSKYNYMALFMGRMETSEVENGVLI
jgi:hypothetical protein